MDPSATHRTVRASTCCWTSRRSGGAPGTSTATAWWAAELLASKKIHQVPVVLRSGKLVGFVTALDLARWLARR